ncbi:MAG: chromosome segregation protein SMC [Candidatus Omnitrophica bacterium]|nr:chromosome segregation protein SMC [Candidatus Omnitrophota bacterium]
MRLKRLDVFGFKSFAKKTAIHFEPGVTAIVGPNGSGKSNLVDAMRWVLGEHNPRDVRAPRLEDVIFNGTDTAAPLSMAEVNLLIENERGLLPIAFTEVLLTRRVYRSGESEYFINQSPCRLKDIQELFLGTGLGGGTYAIIEQGHIDMILSSRPEERRIVFEEASGVAKYLSKKQETLRRLDEVEQHLVRLVDITSEVRRQVALLERQAAKARQYQGQWEQLKSGEVRLAADELRRGEELHQQLSAQVETLKQQQGELETRRQEHLTQLEVCQTAVSSVQAELQEARTRLVEVSSRIEQHASQLALKGQWLEQLAQQSEQLSREEIQLEERGKQAAEQVERLTAQQQTLTQQERELDEQRQAVTRDVAALEQGIAGALTAIDEAKQALFAAASQASQQRNAFASCGLRLQAVDAQAARVTAAQAAAQQRLDALTGKSDAVEQQRRAAQEQVSSLKQQTEQSKRALDEAHGRHQESLGRVQEVQERTLRQRAQVQLLEEVWRRHEGFPDGVKALLANPPDGVLGLLADLLDAQPGYERALEAAMGPLASAIVVRDRHALKRCRELLSADQLGEARFIVLADAELASAAPVPPGVSSQPGVLGPLLTFVKDDPVARPFMDWLLNPWWVADDLGRVMDPAFRSPKQWVSPSGDRWDGQGWQFSGGTPRISSMVGRRQRWERATEELGVLERDLAGCQSACQQADEMRRSCAATETQAREQFDRAVPALAKLESQSAQLAHDIKRLREELETHALDLQELRAQQAQLTQAQADAQQAVAESEARHQAAQETLQASQRRHDESHQRRQSLLVSGAQVDGALGACRERLREGAARVSELQSEYVRLQSDVEAKRAQHRASAERIAELTREREAHEQDAKTLADERVTLEGQVAAVADRLHAEELTRDQVLPTLSAIERDLLALTHSLQQQESQFAERSFRRARIVERLRDVYQIDEAQVLAQQGQEGAAPLSEEERQALTEQVEKLKGKLGTIGPVNLGSVEEYDTLKQRLEFLQTQQQDLVKAREDLKASIAQINRTARQQFRDTFAKITAEFQHYYTQLFRGGEANLILLDEEDVLESGIEIVARPPGKRLQTISLLSGGERALTAIALLFALFKVRPSPFCILDEIDAPLDEANVDRFTSVLEEFLSLSQFILITHNKKTITKADSLYGVTMEQAGISKVVSVKLTRTKTPSVAPAPTAESAASAQPAVEAAAPEAAVTAPADTDAVPA